MVDRQSHPRRRWVILAVGTFSQVATSSFSYGIPLLIPELRRDFGLSLVGCGVVVSAPIAGLLLTLIAWGALADRYGERLVIGTGVGLAALLLLAASQVHGVVALCVLLGLAGAAGASVNAASGRVVMGWFSVQERGLAMGARQTAQPIGVGLAAVCLPPVASAHGVGIALLVPAGFCALAGLGVVTLVRDPPRRPHDSGRDARSPYRTSVLWRIHGASALLVVPQFAVSCFTLVYLVGERQWDAVAAGRLIFAFQLAGAVGRVASGWWSDRVRSRLGPMRQLAIASTGLMAALSLGAWTGQAWIVVVFALAAVVTVADNGLAYTSIAELAGSAWAGRALGVQNTGQNIVSVLTAPVLAAVIGNGRYALAFALVALSPLAAIAVTPVAADQRRLMVGAA